MSLTVVQYKDCAYPTMIGLGGEHELEHCHKNFTNMSDWIQNHSNDPDFRKALKSEIKKVKECIKDLKIIATRHFEGKHLTEQLNVQIANDERILQSLKAALPKRACIIL